MTSHVAGRPGPARQRSRTGPSSLRIPGRRSRRSPVADRTGPVRGASHLLPVTVARRLGRGWYELLLLAVLYLAYAASRLVSPAPPDAAALNGYRLLDLETTLHLAPERTLNDLLFTAPRWMAVAASYFYESMHYAVTVVTLIFLFRRGSAVYHRARDWLVAMTFPALLAFWLFPVAPPRVLPRAVAHDIVAEQHGYGWWGAGGGTAPSGFSSLVNENAAMPSLHVGWAIWVGWNLAHHAQHRLVRAFGWVYPVVTILVVISTGNHYLLDVLAGALLAVVSKVVLDRVVPRVRERRAGASGRPTAPRWT